MVSDKFPNAEEIRKEIEYLEKAEIGNPKTPLAATPVLKEEVVDQFNSALAYHRNAAAVFESAAAFFGRDNVGLEGISYHFKISALMECSGACQIIEFLNKRGALPRLSGVAEPPQPADWFKKDQCDVTCAFIKQLAIFKVAYTLAHKAYATAAKHNDAHSKLALMKCICETSEKIRCVSDMVSHLKVASKDKHAIKNFDRELCSKTWCLARAAGLEAALPCKYQAGVVERYLKKAMFDEAEAKFCEGLSCKGPQADVTQ